MFDRKTLELFEQLARPMHAIAAQMRDDGCDRDMIERMYQREIRGLPAHLQRDFCAYMDEPG
jgi:hypothetical protein